MRICATCVIMNSCLTDAGFPAVAEFHTWPGGRQGAGTSGRITIKAPEGRLLEIRDSWGRGDRWEGYQMWLEGRDAIAVASWDSMHSRAAVREAVRKAMVMR